MSLSNFIRQPHYHFETPPTAPGAGGAPPAADPETPPATPPRVPTGLDAKDPPSTPPAGAWPEDWRTQIAGKDEAVRTRLERFQSPTDVWKSYTSLEKRLSSGEVKAPPGEGASEEEVSAWREANGIPKEVAGYFDGLGDLVVGDDDKPRAEALFTLAQKHNIPPAAAADLIKLSYAQQEEAMNQRHELDISVAEETAEVLREEWGPDYKHNVNRVHSLLDMAPRPSNPEEAGVKDMLLNARYEGNPIMSNPEVVKFLVGLSRDLNPTPTLVPMNGADPIGDIGSRITEIEQMMKNNRAGYNADAKVQEEYRNLIDVRAKLQERARG